MSTLLIEDYPIIVSPKLAALIGLNEAIVLQQIQYWLIENEKHNRNFHDGRYWTFNSIPAWKEAFPFWSEATIKRTFKSLRDKGLLLTGNYNKLRMDKTLWYTIDYDAVAVLNSDEVKMDLPSGQNDPIEERNMTRPIPETTTETTTETTNIMATALPQDRVNKTIGWIATNIFGEVNYKGEFQWEELEEVQEWMGRVLAESRYKETLVELEELAAEGLTFKEAIGELLEPR